MSFYRTKKVKTRASHPCWGCGKIFAKGANLRRDTGAATDGIFSCYWCEVCGPFLDSLPDEDTEDGLMFRELRGHPDYPKGEITP